MPNKKIRQETPDTFRQSFGNHIAHGATLAEEAACTRKDGKLKALPMERPEFPPYLAYERSDDLVRIYGNDEHSRKLQSTDLEMRQQRQRADIADQRIERTLKWVYRFAALVIGTILVFYTQSLLTRTAITTTGWFLKPILTFLKK